MAEHELKTALIKVIAPMVAADEGELFLVSVTDQLVKIHLRGRFAGCPGNSLVSEHVITPLVQAVYPRARVEVSSGALLPDGAERLEP